VRDEAPRIPVLAAPTAAGKTVAALAMARSTPLEVVSADAMQVYRGLDIGTAKPGPLDRVRVPHHVIDVVAPSEPFSVADYVRHAEAAIAAVLERGLVPLVVGGTGL
jgi:tRNA dimethylallyltransferase